MKDFVAPSLLRVLLEYDTEDGKLFWRQRDEEMFPDSRSCKSWNARYANTEAFTATNRSGYRVGRILGCIYRAHRVAWALDSGSWPSDQIDHINGNRSDNRRVNLRPATRAQNSRNVRSHSGASSLYLGVFRNSTNTKWCAQIMIDGRRRHLGLFDYEIHAALAYDAAARKHFGSFSRPNFPEASP
jgi:hypothetical protein